MHVNIYARHCVTVRVSAGVMYWGDADLDTIETARIDGTARRIIKTENGADYFAFLFHAGDIYITDWTYK